MKYFIECMLDCIIALSGGSDKPMESTGQPSTIKDGLIGLTGWLGLTVIFFISLILFKKLAGMESGKAALCSFAIITSIFIILLIIYFCI